MNEAATWLKRKRGDTSFRELGTKTGLNHMTIANAEDGNATAETWIVLAEYFRESALKVLYWAGKLQSPPTDEELEIEFQTKIANGIVKLFPPDQRGNALRRLELDAEIEHERTKQRTTNQTRPRNAD